MQDQWAASRVQGDTFNARYPQLGKSNSQNRAMRLGEKEIWVLEGQVRRTYFAYHVTSGFKKVRSKGRVSHTPDRLLMVATAHFTPHSSFFKSLKRKILPILAQTKRLEAIGTSFFVS